jgi:hypothetical protein
VVPGFENGYVRVVYEQFAAPTVATRDGQTRPIVLFISVDPGPGQLNLRPLSPPRGARPSWRPGVLPRAVRITVLSWPPAPSDLGTPGTDVPRGTIEDNAWDGGRLLIATFRPLDYGVGAGRHPSVTTFLSDGVVEVSTKGVRRRMGVQAGDAFWFDAGTRLTVIDDYPIGAAIVQLQRRR